MCPDDDVDVPDEPQPPAHHHRAARQGAHPQDQGLPRPRHRGEESQGQDLNWSCGQPATVITISNMASSSRYNWTQIYYFLNSSKV